MELIIGMLIGLMVGFMLGGMICFSAFDDELKRGIVVCRKVYYRATPIDPAQITLPSR